MIKYRLECGKGHAFEAWFRNSADYDRQAAKGQISCPSCGSSDIAKALMAPRIATKRRAEPRQPPAAPGDRQRLQGELIRVMQDIRREVEAKAENVGRRFAEEARRIHYEEAPARGIYGEATPVEAQELTEEGIVVVPLPPLPEDAN
jgi:hypothetical protein